jgi:PEP-CTERM motif
MNHNVVKLIGATLMGGLGLWTVAMPVSANSVNWAVGFNDQTTNYGYVPNPANSSLIYNSEAGTPNNGAPAGISFNSNDSSASYSYLPNPGLALGGLSAGTMNLSSVGAVADVTASLATGATHLYASSSYGTGGVTSGTAFISAIMEDLVTFNLSTASASVTLGFALDGILSLNGDPQASYNQSIEYEIGSAYMEWEAQSGSSPYTGNTTGFDSFAYTNDSISGFNFLGAITVTNGETLPFYFIQTMNCNDGAVCDFSNTGQISLTLPAGDSFTSNSGVFLTQSESAAPEPGSLMLMGLGIAALGWIRHRRVVR